MNRADERALAWALVEAAGTDLPVGTRVRLNMMIGAGELEGAIVELLTHHAHGGAPISGGLVVALNAWVFGYTGTAAEARLRQLVDLISLASLEGRSPTVDGQVS